VRLARSDGWSAWTHPAVLRAATAVVAVSPAVAFSLLWSAKFLVRAHGLKQAEVGALLWIPPVIFDAGAILFGHLSSLRRDHGVPPRLLFAIAALLTASLAAMPLAESPIGAVLVSGVSMAGGGALFALLSADMLARMPTTQVAAAGGVTAAAQSLAYIIANPLIGASVDAHQSYTPILWQLGAWILPGCAVWLLWPPPPVTDR
jgi:predicted MFS family arabinose efflux permease